MTTISLILLIILFIPTVYIFLIALASTKPARQISFKERNPLTFFVIAIPAHDEETVIAATVQRLLALDYPKNQFSIHIVADHCTDLTAEKARLAGAVVHERNEGPRSGKGAALSWLFQRVLQDPLTTAVVIFDADTLVDPQFLRVMDAHLVEGVKVIQGQHRIINPHQGWFPALTWAMFIIDNRFQNLGRSNLGWSAKHMGDSICFQADVLRRLGWGEGLTEDYQLRQRLLLDGIRIVYEPAAIGRGEAPLTWSLARAQRARWLRGTHDASQKFASELLRAAIEKRSGALLDGALQAYLPSYSSLTMAAGILFAIQILINLAGGSIFPSNIIIAWGILLIFLYFYPLFGLLLERAPANAYLAIMSGPIFIIWRTWLALRTRLSSHSVTWVRTSHGGRQ